MKIDMSHITGFRKWKAVTEKEQTFVTSASGVGNEDAERAVQSAQDLIGLYGRGRSVFSKDDQDQPKDGSKSGETQPAQPAQPIKKEEIVQGQPLVSRKDGELGKIDVAKVQSYLVARYYADYHGTPINGTLDANTISGIQKFREDHPDSKSDPAPSINNQKQITIGAKTLAAINAEVQKWTNVSKAVDFWFEDYYNKSWETGAKSPESSISPAVDSASPVNQQKSSDKKKKALAVVKTPGSTATPAVKTGKVKPFTDEEMNELEITRVREVEKSSIEKQLPSINKHSWPIGLNNSYVNSMNDLSKQIVDFFENPKNLQKFKGKGSYIDAVVPDNIAGAKDAFGKWFNDTITPKLKSVGSGNSAILLGVKAKILKKMDLNDLTDVVKWQPIALKDKTATKTVLFGKVFSIDVDF